jgi:hypothetical protein
MANPEGSCPERKRSPSKRMTQKRITGATRATSFFKMAKNRGGGGECPRPRPAGGSRSVPSQRASPAKAKQVAICAQPRLNQVRTPSFPPLPIPAVVQRD